VRHVLCHTLAARMHIIRPGGDIMNTWKFVGGLAVATVVAGVLFNLKDIQRYIRISTM
jgi:hypothetical protein